MTEIRLLAGLQESMAEIQRLKARMLIGTPTFYKDLSLISLVIGFGVSSSPRRIYF